ncbi:putative lipid II flippase FtsW [Patulibacter defluvii]|uniref:putative lipid II flippase FtsW n=1 Tax=Patulibacter defluvii TaxID=3095358 RepID=UPI002A751D73|nr:putative lipid II flippase FtsW [Patulibacter sp. DM4]
MPPLRRAPELRREYERLLSVVLVLVVLGAIWVYSASSSEQILQGGGDGTSFLIRYVMFGAIGFAVLAAASRAGVATLRRLTLPMLAVALVLCMAVVVPGVGRQVNGAYRWLGTGAVGFQPSELAKFSMVAFLALTLSQRKRPMVEFRDALPYLAVLGVFVMIVAGLQRDLGTAIVIAGASLCVMVAYGMPLRFFMPLGGIAGAGLLVLVLMQPYRMARLTNFLSPWSDAAGTGYQATQGQIAIGSGGFFGNGLGNSVQKAEWLPEAHTDFILAVVGEELGAIGVLMLLFLYGAVAYLGLRIADRTKGTYQKLLAIGITGVIVCQALLNVWVVLGIFPLTGVPLPFISYGSTNLVVLLAGIGVLLNIARGTPYVETAADAPDPGGRGSRRRRRPARPKPKPAPRRRPRPVAPRPAPTTPSFASARELVRGGHLRLVEEDARDGAHTSRSARDGADDRDRSRRDRGARGARAGGRRRAAG